MKKSNINVEFVKNPLRSGARLGSTTREFMKEPRIFTSVACVQQYFSPILESEIISRLITLNVPNKNVTFATMVHKYPEKSGGRKRPSPQGIIYHLQINIEVFNLRIC